MEIAAPLPSLQSIIPPGIFLGVSLILRGNGRFLFGIRPPKEFKDQQPILELTGIGGKLEPEDVSFEAAVQREACEEIGSQVTLLPSQTTLIVRSQADLTWLSLEDNQCPAAVVFRGHRTPPHQPWHPNHRDIGCLVVFLADLISTPRLTQELPHMIWLNPEHILQVAQADLCLGSLLNDGAELVLGQTPAPLGSTWVRLTDSQEALAIALGEKTTAFYSSLLTS
jgi:hypothetical protein